MHCPWRWPKAQALKAKASPEERLELERAYDERLLNPYVAAERGYIDAVIEPADTRRQLVAALEVLSTKREHLVARGHDNMPL